MTYTIKVTAHIVLVILAFLGAYTLRLGLGVDWWLVAPEEARLVISWALIYGAIAGAFELALRNERSAWTYASIADVAGLVRATGLTALTFLAFIFISNRGITLPRSTLILSWMLSLFILVGVRLAWRMRVERSFRSVIFGLNAGPLTGKPLVLVGEPSSIAAFLKSQVNQVTRAYAAIGIVTPGGAFLGQRIHGVRVVGSSADLEGLLAAPAYQPPERVGVLFLQDAALGPKLEPGMIGRLRKTGRPLLRQPSVTELKTGGDGLREIAVEEFLAREPVVLDSAPIERLVSGRRILVTGAGGSIGSEICRQLISLGCAHITLVDHSEFLLFETDRGLADIDRAVSKCAMLCDIRDTARVSHIFETELPEIVFHAAALKHVTLVEQNPCEAVLTNVMGTWNVIAAARNSKVGQFVLISTDKAVDPSSFMGATKRLAEALLPSASKFMRSCVVRFGNVLGSAGSVVPIFREQIERGGPVTVTHRDVERYFMTIPEAVQLVLHAAAISAEGEKLKTRKFLLEMGQPVKIYDLARQMIELSGLRPGFDVDIEITGLKPGEKITEELTDANEIARPVSVGLSELDTQGLVAELSDADVNRIARLAREGGPEAAREAVLHHVARIRALA